MFGGFMMKMTENEQKVARLYERYLYAKKRYEMGGSYEQELYYY